MVVLGDIGSLVLDYQLVQVAPVRFIEIPDHKPVGFYPGHGFRYTRVESG
jgi:hypothetical protein